MFGGWLSFSSQLVQDGLKSILASPSMYFSHASLGVAALVAATAHKFLSPSADHLVETTGDIAWYLVLGNYRYNLRDCLYVGMVS